MSITEPLLTEPVPGIYLPTPPDDFEKYKYFGKPRRLVFAWLLISAIGVLYGYIHVAERAWLVTPIMWLLLMVMIPPVVVNFWLRIGSPRLSLAEHQATVAAYQEQGETVDVFLPSCGEPLAVLNNTFLYVSNLRWGAAKTAYVLDDSAREEVRLLAERYGFQYVVRPDPGHMKKAGQPDARTRRQHRRLYRGHRRRFRRATGFPLRDHALLRRPRRRYRPDGSVLRCHRSVASLHPALRRHLQEIFFRFIQPSRDRYKAAICAGTNLVYRRSAVIDAVASPGYR